ncbi:MAG: hypothetical protein IT198_05300 [Acidimicrobiia bacterium]|nr:hypothetical protein [Acidimicrobiia bacterium]
MTDPEGDETIEELEGDPDSAVSRAELAELREALRAVGPAPVDEVTRRRHISAAVAAATRATLAEDNEQAGPSHDVWPVVEMSGRRRRALVGVFAAAAVLAALALVVTRMGDAGPGGSDGPPLATGGSGSVEVYDLGDLGSVVDAAALAALAEPTADTPRRPLAGPAARCATELAEEEVATADLDAVGNASYGGERILVLVYADGSVLGLDTDCGVRLGTP